MMTLILRRLLALPTILLVIYTITVILAFAIPGNPVENPEKRPKPEVVEQMKKQYNLDSFPNFYFSYLDSATGFEYMRDKLSGELAREREAAIAEGLPAPHRPIFDFGPSLKYDDKTVNEIIADSLPVSVTLGASAILIALLIATISGVIGAVKPNSLADLSTLSVAMIGISLPSFVTATILLLVFSILVFLFARRRNVTSAALVRVGLVYVVLAAGAMAGAETVLSVARTPKWDGVSGICIWIVLFPMLLPTRPRDQAAELAAAASKTTPD